MKMKLLLLTFALGPLILIGCTTGKASTSPDKSAAVAGAGYMKPGPGNANAGQRVGSKLNGK